MASILSCLLPDRFAAYVSVAMLAHYDPPVCPDPRPARLLAVVGETDRIYSIKDGLTFQIDHPQPPGPLAVEAAAWAATNGCSPDPVDEVEADGKTVRTYDCPAGADFTIYIHPGGHVWSLGGHGDLINEAIWEFLDGGG